MSDHTYIHYGHRRSWHIARLHTRGINTWLTLCGRLITTTDTMEELPAAKSCETCLRIAARADEDRPGWENGVFVGQRVAVTGGIQVVEDDPSTSPVDPVTGMP